MSWSFSIFSFSRLKKMRSAYSYVGVMTHPRQQRTRMSRQNARISGQNLFLDEGTSVGCLYPSFEAQVPSSTSVLNLISVATFAPQFLYIAHNEGKTARRIMCRRGFDGGYSRHIIDEHMLLGLRPIIILVEKHSHAPSRIRFGGTQ